MEIVLWMIGGILLAVLVFCTLGLSSIFKRRNNNIQKKAELAKARREVKISPGYESFADSFADKVLSIARKTTAECIYGTSKVIVYCEVLDIDGNEIVEPLRFYENIIPYLRIL